MEKYGNGFDLIITSTYSSVSNVLAVFDSCYHSLLVLYKHLQNVKNMQTRQLMVLIQKMEDACRVHFELSISKFQFKTCEYSSFLN